MAFGRLSKPDNQQRVLRRWRDQNFRPPKAAQKNEHLGDRVLPDDGANQEASLLEYPFPIHLQAVDIYPNKHHLLWWLLYLK